ncbi:hypothetical protein HK099_000461 [Clydaea vesicula]|uniref:Uncharacterized protein n=1 Tax=Clydaea vesicula TaxID=447962 RepID=A0AAD5U4F3_9FUNG|nr:hypothetical protein HK099_000461 [Clydaea vesicula]
MSERNPSQDFTDRLAELKLRILRERVQSLNNQKKIIVDDFVYVPKLKETAYLNQSYFQQQPNEEKQENLITENNKLPYLNKSVNKIPIKNDFKEKEQEDSYDKVTNVEELRGNSAIYVKNHEAKINNSTVEIQKSKPCSSESICKHREESHHRDDKLGLNMEEMIRNVTMQNFQLQQMILQNTLISQVGKINNSQVLPSEIFTQNKQPFAQQQQKSLFLVNEFTQTERTQENLNKVENTKSEALKPRKRTAILKKSLRAAFLAVFFVSFLKHLLLKKKKLPKRISRAMLITSEGLLKKHYKKLIEFHSAIAEIALCSKDGGLIMGKDSFFQSNKVGETCLKKVLHHLTSCIEQISFEDLVSKYGNTSPIITVLKLIVTGEGIPPYFLWTGNDCLINLSNNNQNYENNNLENGNVVISNPNQIKTAIIYFLILKNLVIKLLLQPVESNLISKYNLKVVKNLKSVSMFIYYIVYTICKPLDLISSPPVTTFCPEFENLLDSIEEKFLELEQKKKTNNTTTESNLNNSFRGLDSFSSKKNFTHYDKQFLKLSKSLQFSLEDSQQRIGLWVTSMLVSNQKIDFFL